MHETVIAGAILAEAKKHGNPVALRIEVGELGPLPPQELLATLQTMTDAKVMMEVREALVRCVCGFAGRPNILERGHDYCLYDCPSCGSVPPLVEGQEIRLVSIDVNREEKGLG